MTVMEATLQHQQFGDTVVSRGASIGSILVKAMAVSKRRKECYTPYPQGSGCIVAISIVMVVTLWLKECFTAGNHSMEVMASRLGATSNNGIAVALLVVVMDVQKQ